jgi:hypothetical protein
MQMPSTPRHGCPGVSPGSRAAGLNSATYGRARGLLNLGRMRPLLIVGLLASGCADRTFVRPVDRGDGRPTVEVECIVVDVESANDLPARAENLGWVSVPEQPSDEETAHALHDRVCAMGGNALTRLARVQELGEAGYVLKGNAWRVAEVPTSQGELRHAR